MLTEEKEFKIYDTLEFEKKEWSKYMITYFFGEYQVCVQMIKFINYIINKIII